MSTRRLITLALLCGLAILVAGGVWLLLAGRAGDPSSQVVTAELGQPATIGPLEVTAVSAEVAEDGTVALEVVMKAVTDGVQDPASGWAVVSNRNLALVERADAPAGIADACPSGRLQQGESVRCRVFFRATVPQLEAGLQALYGRGDQRAFWAITPG